MVKPYSVTQQSSALKLAASSVMQEKECIGMDFNTSNWGVDYYQVMRQCIISV